MQRCPGIGLEQQLRTKPPGTAFHRRRYRTQQLDAVQVLFGQQLLGGAAGFIEKPLGLPRLVRFGA